MVNKYEKNLLDCASKFDAVVEACGEITKLTIEIVDNKDEDACRILMKKISDISASGRETYVTEAKQLANVLKDRVIDYYGYNHVKKICGLNSKKDNADNRTLDDLLAELDELVGLKKVKEQVNDLIAYQTVQKLRSDRGFHSAKNTLHLAFTGNPGTGKTTVARIVGRVYKKIGLLSKGHFIEVSRTDLIAGYQGQTALKVKKVIEEAKGGVLFIDEAYSITENDHSDSYGRECLTELTKALEDYREDLAVIVAGYTEPMNLFFESNPGLRSRFNTFIEFDDYSPQELLNILEMICKKNDYVISTELKEKILIYFERLVDKKKENFANGRMVRNIYDNLVMAQAKRIIGQDTYTDEDLTVLKDMDFDEENDTYM